MATRASLRAFRKVPAACWLLVLLTGVNLQAGEPLVVVKGGLSPDKRYAVAVVPQKPGQFIDEADARVFLLDGKTHRKIGPLEEVDASGGEGGQTTGNVEAAWSPDGRYLAVNYRVGPGSGCDQLYRLVGRRAVPVKLPDPRTHPKGKVLDVLYLRSSTGEELRWQDDRTLIGSNWGHPFKADFSDAEIARTWLPADFDGTLEYVYKLGPHDHWAVADVLIPPPHP